MNKILNEIYHSKNENIYKVSISQEYSNIYLHRLLIKCQKMTNFRFEVTVALVLPSSVAVFLIHVSQCFLRGNYGAVANIQSVQICLFITVYGRLNILTNKRPNCFRRFKNYLFLRIFTFV